MLILVLDPGGNLALNDALEDGFGHGKSIITGENGGNGSAVKY